MIAAPMLLRKAPVDRVHRHQGGALSLRLRVPEIARIAAPGHRLHFRLTALEQLRRPHYVVDAQADVVSVLVVPGADAKALGALADAGTVDVLGPVGTALRPGERALRIRCDASAVPFLEFLRRSAAPGSLHAHCEDTPERWMREALPEACALFDGHSSAHIGIESLNVLAGTRAWIDRKLAQADAADRSGLVMLTDTTLGCGIGMCLTCAIATPRGYLRACRSGPVLPAAELLP